MEDTVTKKSYSLFIPCDEANHVCDKSQYKEASLLEKVKLSIHLMYCKACQKYTKNNTKLTKALNDKKVDYIKDSEMNELEKQFQEQLKDFSKNQ